MQRNICLYDFLAYYEYYRTEDSCMSVLPITRLSVRWSVCFHVLLSFVVLCYDLIHAYQEGHVVNEIRLSKTNKYCRSGILQWV